MPSERSDRVFPVRRADRGRPRRAGAELVRGRRGRESV